MSPTQKRLPENGSSSISRRRTSRIRGDNDEPAPWNLERPRGAPRLRGRTALRGSHRHRLGSLGKSANPKARTGPALASITRSGQPNPLWEREPDSPHTGFARLGVRNARIAFGRTHDQSSWDSSRERSACTSVAESRRTHGRDQIHWFTKCAALSWAFGS